MVRAIRRDMVKIDGTTHDNPLRAPATIHDFVHNMAQAGMFIFNVLISDVDTTGNTGIPKTSRKVSRQQRAERQ